MKNELSNFSDENILKYSHHFNKSNHQWAEFRKTSHFREEQLNVNVYDFAYVVSDAPVGTCFKGCVFDENREPIDCSFSRYEPSDTISLIQNRSFDKAPYYDIEAIYLGEIRNHWGSFLNDTIARLWYKLDNPKDNIYVLSASHPSIGTVYHKNIYRFFELLGINKEQLIIVDDIAQFRKLIIPDLSFLLNSYYTIEYLKIFEFIHQRNNIPSYPYEKVYFSRKAHSSTSKTDFGEESIINFMEVNHFKVVFPEEHDLLEQIGIVNSCKVFASIGGALAHNIVFYDLLKGTKPIMFLFNRMDGYQWHQWLFNEAKGIQINYIDCFQSPYRLFFKTPVSGPFLFGLNKNVKKFARDYNMTLPKQRFGYTCKSFVLYSIQVFKKQLYDFKNNFIKYNKKNK